MLRRRTGSDTAAAIAPSRPGADSCLRTLTGAAVFSLLLVAAPEGTPPLPSLRADELPAGGVVAPRTSSLPADAGPLLTCHAGPGDDEPLRGAVTSPPSGPGDDEPLAAAAPGPGDDEPLCSSTQALLRGNHLRLEILSNYRKRAVLRILAGGCSVRALPFDPASASGPAPDPQTGIWRLPVELDLETLQSTLGRADLLVSPQGTIELEIALYNQSSGALVKSTVWRSEVVWAPWLGFQADIPVAGAGLAGTAASGTAVPSALGPAAGTGTVASAPPLTAVLHLRAGDTYYYFVGAWRRDALELPLLQALGTECVRVLAADRLDTTAPQSGIVRPLDSPSRNRDAVPYVALWCYSDDSGWVRSRVYAVP